MIPNLTIKPISENVICVILSTGAIVEISDSGGLGGDIHISESAEKLQIGRFKRIQIVAKGADNTNTFHVEMKTGVGC
jgi:hypothetical protein